MKHYHITTGPLMNPTSVREVEYHEAIICTNGWLVFADETGAVVEAMSPGEWDYLTSTQNTYFVNVEQRN